MASLLPTPEPPDPVEGALGHFEHTNWVKASLKALDQGTARADGGTIQGNLVINDPNSQNAYLQLVGDGFRGLVGFSSQGKPRWQMNLGDDIGESGLNNAGSRFGLHSFNDAGGYHRTALDGDRNTGLLTVAGDPTAPLGIATKQYVDSRIPIGTIIMFPTATLPSEMQPYWQVCDGSPTVPGSPLAGLVGANVPDLRGLFVVGAGKNADASTGAVTEYPVGKGAKLGKEAVVLTQAQTPVKSHTHPINHDHPDVISGNGSPHSHTINHDHASNVTTSDTHHHSLSIREGTGTGDGYYVDTNPTDGGVQRTLAASQTSDDTHNHSFDTPAHTGSSGPESLHYHHVNTPMYNGNSGAGADANATAHENRPPYFALVYLIKKA